MKDVQKGKPVTLSNGKKVKPENKNSKRVQILKGLMQKLIALKAWPKEEYNGEMLAYADEQNLVLAIESLNYNGKQRVRELIREGYLIPRSGATEDDLANFYLCPTKEIHAIVTKKRS
jgi:hypothetical protein